MTGKASLYNLGADPGVVDFMSAVLSTHDKFHRMVSQVFGGHKAFQDALNSVSVCVCVMCVCVGVCDVCVWCCDIAALCVCRLVEYLSTSQSLLNNIPKLHCW